MVLLPGSVQCKQHFSDVVSTFLLYQHGGTYFDATTYVIDDPTEIFEAEEYFDSYGPVNAYNSRGNDLIPNYCLHFKQPKHYFCYVMRNFLFDYWKENDIDVYWQWYSFATIAWQEDPKVFRFVQRVLKQNSKSKAYQVWGAVLLKGYSQALYENIKKSGQKVFKLNRANKVSKQNLDNTVLGYLINSTQQQQK